MNNHLMTADEALFQAKFHRVGIKYIVGPEQAEEVTIEPLKAIEISKLPGDFSWTQRKIRLYYETLKIDFKPANRILWLGMRIEKSSGKKLTVSEWKQLDNASAVEIQEFVSERIDSMEAGE